MTSKVQYFFCGLLAMLPFFLSGSLSGADLVRNGRACCMVLLPAQHSQSEAIAAQELVDYTRKITGAALSVVMKADQKGGGCLRLLSGKPAAEILKGRRMQPDGFVIAVSGPDITIASPTGLGVLYGVYELLERHCGVRWLLPGKDGEFFPSRQTLSVPAGIRVFNPSFTDRTMAPTGGNAFGGRYGALETWKWLSRNKIRFSVYLRGIRDSGRISDDNYLLGLGGFANAGGHETFYKAVPDSLLKTHPEYFCLVNGERLPQFHPTVKIGGCTYAQVCTSHPDVNRRIADFILKTLQRGRRMGYDSSFLYGAGDNCSTWCHCDRCRSLFNNYVPDRFYYMVQESSKLVFQAMPDADLSAWIYSDFRRPPKKFFPDPRIKMTFCAHGRCYTHALDDPACPINARMLKLLNEWVDINPNQKIYEYYCVGASYAPNEKIIARDLQYYHRRKFRGWHDEISAPDAIYSARVEKGANGVPKRKNWQSRWQGTYLAAKMLWDVTLDPEKLLDEANALWYGPAFPEMKPYRKLLGELWNSLSVHRVYGPGGVAFPGGYCMLLPEAEKLEGYLTRAEALAAGREPYLKRIQEEHEWFRRMWQKPGRELRQGKKASGKIRKAVDAVVLDGVLKENTWRQAEILGTFVRQSGEAPGQGTFVKAAFDSRNLYIAFVSMEPDPAKAKVENLKRDSQIWSDNSVEFMINPAGTASDYYYFAVNSKNAVLDMVMRNGVLEASYDSSMKSFVRTEKDRWILECAIPLEKLGGGLIPGSLWQMNFCRGRRLYGGVSELSSIADGAFQGKFKTFTMGDTPLKNGSMNDVVKAVPRGKWKIPSGLLPRHWTLGQNHGNAVGEAILRDPLVGEYELHVSRGQIFQYLLDSAPAPRQVRITLQAYGKGELKVSFYRFIKVPDGDRAVKRVNQKTENAGTFKLTENKTRYECTYTVKAGEQVFLALYGVQDAFVDNVSVFQ